MVLNCVNFKRECGKTVFSLKKLRVKKKSRSSLQDNNQYFQFIYFALTLSDNKFWSRYTVLLCVIWIASPPRLWRRNSRALSELMCPGVWQFLGTSQTKGKLHLSMRYVCVTEGKLKYHWFISMIRNSHGGSKECSSIIRHELSNNFFFFFNIRKRLLIKILDDNSPDMIV